MRPFRPSPDGYVRSDWLLARRAQDRLHPRSRPTRSHIGCLRLMSNPRHQDVRSRPGKDDHGFRQPPVGRSGSWHCREKPQIAIVFGEASAMPVDKDYNNQTAIGPSPYSGKNVSAIPQPQEVRESLGNFPLDGRQYGMPLVVRSAIPPGLTMETKKFVDFRKFVCKFKGESASKDKTDSGCRALGMPLRWRGGPVTSLMHSFSAKYQNRAELLEVPILSGAIPSNTGGGLHPRFLTESLRPLTESPRPLAESPWPKARGLWPKARGLWPKDSVNG